MLTMTTTKPSLKRQMVGILDQFLRGVISARELRSAALPLLQISAHKRGRKNYIERYLVDISGKKDSELTRDYIYELRDMIIGDAVTSEKDRGRVFKRTLRKLIERYFYEEIEEAYYLSLLYDLMFEFDSEVEREPAVKNFFAQIQSATPIHDDQMTVVEIAETQDVIYDKTMDFYEEYFKSLWDD